MDTTQMTAPKSAQVRAEEFAFNYSESYATVARSAYLAGHAAGVEDARELAEAVEKFINPNTLDWQESSDNHDEMSAALTRFKALAGQA